MDLGVVFTFLSTLMITSFVDVYGNRVASDVVFVVDGSSRISASQFIREKKFIVNIINKLDITKQGTNVGIIVYGSNIGDTVSLSPFKSKSMLNLLTRGLRKMSNRGRNTAIGIKNAVDMLKQSSRTPVQQFMVVLMGGSSDLPSSTIQEAENAKKQGITIFGIGFGSNQPPQFEKEFLDITSLLETLYIGQTFQELNQFATPIAELLKTDVRDDDFCGGKRLECPPLKRLQPISQKVYSSGCFRIQYQCVFDASSRTNVIH